MIKECLICGKEFEKSPSHTLGRWLNEVKYCSRVCYFKSRENKPSWNSGLTKETDERVAKIATTKTGREVPALRGENHPLWKGDAVGYRALHSWVVRHLGRADGGACTRCGSDKNMHWANKSHEYKRDLGDWTRLCQSCHFKFDEIKGFTATQFKKGHAPWHKGKKTGLVPRSAFTKGHVPWNKKST